jgi:hypothetical protein
MHYRIEQDRNDIELGDKLLKWSLPLSNKK